MSELHIQYNIFVFIANCIKKYFDQLEGLVDWLALSYFTSFLQRIPLYINCSWYLSTT